MKTYTIYGFGITLASAILSLLLLAMGFFTAERLGTALLIIIPCSLIITILGIVMATKAVRSTTGSQGFTYGQAWRAAFFTMVAAAVFGSVFNFAYFSYINPNFNEATVEWTRSMMESRNMPSATIDKKIEEIEAKGTVFNQVKNGVLFSLIGGAIFGLITAAIMKRPPVEDLTQAPPPISG